MKKFIVLLMAFTLLFSLSGCGGKKILIAYFSWSGNTEAAAREIQKEAGGDLYRINTLQEYPLDHDRLRGRVFAELKHDERPALKGPVPDIKKYDIIFIGYPIWGHTAPMPVLTFLEMCDLKGKTVVPFCTSRRADISASTPAIMRSADGAEVLKGLRVENKDEIGPWLKEIGIKK